jgi:hypothetical protein
LDNQELASTRLVDGPQDFDLADYGKRFGYLNRTYVAGVKPLVEVFYLAHPKGFERDRLVSVIAGWHLVACNYIPAAWREAVESVHWDRVKFNDVAGILRGGISRYDRACQTVIALELAFRYSSIPALQTFDVRRFVQLRPALYRFPDPDTAGWFAHGKDEHHEKLVRALVGGRTASVAKARSFLREAGQGRTMTHRSAVLLGEHARQAGCKKPSFITIATRSAPQHCVAENCFLGIAEEVAEAFNAERDKIISTNPA